MAGEFIDTDLNRVYNNTESNLKHKLEEIAVYHGVKRLKLDGDIVTADEGGHEPCVVPASLLNSNIRHRESDIVPNFFNGIEGNCCCFFF